MLEKWLLKKWLKELQINVDVMRKMANDYRSQGGFLEVGETIEKFKAGELVPYELLAEGRKTELEFADVTERLANCYQKLLDHVKKMAEKQ
jgi:hypothetical protein